ncbi:23S rRNA (uracil(1939)-C(5))-methyltransferase RlmD [Carnobacterium sp. ISL-102]|uniref:23S rRNA (uracil(1939)-C(5))-methyltransferase RlmD n=1 Tax=Carnobacterium sp. ISL-102 TaxID=2819142 RepID=UPI001BE79D3F|nr:23S rRNA (uracil(1939)-C(5))-methyltransferase RlmD [Carnobacterium sp. ISL-102]MBT2731150.1 23S rRNA (uracil(1939)-C(5))-methyltransferase RlmD [Carnobacterium sp. ISL-102]
MKADKVVPVQKNEKHTVKIEDLTHEGFGVARIKGYSLFIENALPGEQVEVKIHKTGKSFGYAKVMNRLNSSEDRVVIQDENYTRVGITPLQHMRYPAQLDFKKQQVINSLQRIAKLPDVPVYDTIGMANPSGYRNKAQIPVRKIDDKLTTGFFRKNSHEVIPMENFYIQDPKIDEAIIAVRDIMRVYGVKPYNENENIGNLRHIIVRRGYYTGEIMIVLVTRTAKLFPTSKIIPDILEAIPEVVSIVQNVNPKHTNVILGEDSIVLYGEDKFKDTLLGNTFEISHRSFYQVNPLQTEKLYQTVLDFAELTGEETVIDAYSGIGTITLTLAKNAKHVYGIEVIEPAVENAKANAELNNIDNVTFEAGAAEEVMVAWAEEDRTADLLVVDPPRKGLEKEFTDAVIAIKPTKMIYVSCNPATLSRDLALLTEGGYTVKKVQPVDLFPQTTHVESVTLLVRD